MCMSNYVTDEAFTGVSGEDSYPSEMQVLVEDAPPEIWLPPSDAVAMIHTYSGCRAGKFGLKQAADQGELGEVRMIDGTPHYSQSQLIAWMDSWEYHPPAGLHLSRPGPIPPIDPIPEFWRRIAPKYFCRVRNGKPDTKEANEALPWGEEPANG